MIDFVNDIIELIPNVEKILIVLDITALVILSLIIAGLIKRGMPYRGAAVGLPIIMIMVHILRDPMMNEYFLWCLIVLAVAMLPAIALAFMTNRAAKRHSTKE